MPSPSITEPERPFSISMYADIISATAKVTIFLRTSKNLTHFIPGKPLYPLFYYNRAICLRSQHRNSGLRPRMLITLALPIKHGDISMRGRRPLFLCHQSKRSVLHSYIRYSAIHSTFIDYELSTIPKITLYTHMPKFDYAIYASLGRIPVKTE